MQAISAVKTLSASLTSHTHAQKIAELEVGFTTVQYRMQCKCLTMRLTPH